MKLGVIKEQHPDESRVAATPDSVKRLTKLGFTLQIESGAGARAGYRDVDYVEAGAEIAASAADCARDARGVLCVRRPDGGLAQSMDVLSSQANLAGYKCVLEATSVFGRAFPMMMTAAGTVAPAKVFVIGAGVAGLQAIATARRLGAVVSGTDVRPAVKEQVESLGAKFVMVESGETEAAETAGGYAREMSDDYKRRQAELVADTVAKQDIVISTALIPGRPAPVLVTQDMVERMRQGSVVVDLAVEQGGNCPLSRVNEVVNHKGVLIVGYANMPGRLATDASGLYSRNLVNFLGAFVDADAAALTFNWEDELVQGTGLSRDGALVHPMFDKAA